MGFCTFPICSVVSAHRVASVTHDGEPVLPVKDNNYVVTIHVAWRFFFSSDIWSLIMGRRMELNLEQS